MSPSVAMWCAMFSQKSFLLTSQNINEGTACKLNRYRMFIAHACLLQRPLQSPVSDELGNNIKQCQTNTVCTDGHHGHSMTALLSYIMATWGDWSAGSKFQSLPVNSSQAPEHKAGAGHATPHNCREGTLCSPARSTLYP